MKTERRHALETNTLAAELATWSEKLRPYTGSILTGLAVVLGLYAALSWWNSRGARLEAEAWDTYERAMLQGDSSYNGVYRVASNEVFAGTRAPEWAYVAWADRQLRLAANNYLIDREGSKENLTNIEAVYVQFATEALDAEVRNRARFGLARVSEMQERFDEAREHYAKVDGALANVAADRLKELEDKEQNIGDSSKWLATAELPTPAAPPGGNLPARPDFDATLPPADGAEAPFNASDAIDDFLGGLDSGGTAGGRYGEGGAATTTEGATPEGTNPEGATPESPNSPATAGDATDGNAAGDSAAEGSSTEASGSSTESSGDAPTTESPPADDSAAPAPESDEPPAADGATPAPQ